MTTRPEDLNHSDEKFTVESWTDGTLTQVQVIEPADADGTPGKVVGEGTSRRAKGDRRNPHLGLILAAARAFESAADEYYETAREFGWSDDNMLTFTAEEAAAIKKSVNALLRVEKANVKA